MLIAKIEREVIDNRKPEQEKVVEPKTFDIDVIPDYNKSLSKVTVKAVTSDIDANIIPENIKLGVEILGVVGNSAPDKPDQSKTTIPTKERQVVRADLGYELAENIVEPIPDEYADITGVTATAEDVLNGKVFIDNEGNEVQGTAELKDDLTTELTAQDEAITSLETAVDKLPEPKGSSDPYLLNPTWWDIQRILEEDDDTEYASKSIVLINDYSDTIQFVTSNNPNNTYSPRKIKTSDGAVYTGANVHTHTWNKEYDKPCYVGSEKVYSTRYFIYYNDEDHIINSLGCYNGNATSLSILTNSIIYAICDKVELSTYSNYKLLNDAFSLQCFRAKYITNNSYGDISGMFRNTQNLKYCVIDEIVYNVEAISKPDSLSAMWYNNSSIEVIGGKIDCVDKTSLSSIFYGCVALRKVYLKNIKLALDLGSYTNYGMYISDDTLINTAKELWDLTDGTSQKLGLSTPSKARIDAIYVKLVDVTDEMIANDQYITNKKPCVVCESTDDGAMTLRAYILSKNWTIG